MGCNVRRAAWRPNEAKGGVEIRREGVRTGLAVVESEALEELSAERRATRLSDDIAGEGGGQGMVWCGKGVVVRGGEDWVW